MSQVLRSEIASYQVQVETWQADHNDAILYYDVRESVNFGIYLFERLNNLDEDIQLSIFTKKIGAQEGVRFQAEIIQLFRDWLQTSEDCGEMVCYLSKKDYPIEDWDKLRDCIREVKGILTPDNEFFVSPALIELRDKAIDAHRSGLAEVIN